MIVISQSEAMAIYRTMLAVPDHGKDPCQMQVQKELRINLERMAGDNEWPTVLDQGTTERTKGKTSFSKDHGNKQESTELQSQQEGNHQESVVTVDTSEEKKVNAELCTDQQEMGSPDVEYIHTGQKCLRTVSVSKS